jgi:hypothetical protein
MQSMSTPDRQRFTTLSESEALFVESAFALLLPGHGHDPHETWSNAAELVDERLRSGGDCLLQIAIDLGIGDVRLSGAQVAKAYHCGIAAIQRHCIATYGKAFHELTQLQQRVVLGLLERGSARSGLQYHDVLFALLVQHAAEAYFQARQVSRGYDKQVALAPVTPPAR